MPHVRDNVNPDRGMQDLNVKRRGLTKEINNLTENITTKNYFIDLKMIYCLR